MSIVLFTGSGSAATSQWVSTSDGDWSDSGNWDAAGVPNAVGDRAELTGGMTANGETRTITLDADVTLGEMFMRGNTRESRYVITGSRDLYLDSGGGGVSIEGGQGGNGSDHVIGVDMIVKDSNMGVTGRQLTFTGNIVSSASISSIDLTVDLTNENQAVVMSGNNDFGDGTVDIEDGTVILRSADAGGGVGTPITLNGDNTGLRLELDSAVDWGHELTVSGTGTVLNVQSASGVENQTQTLRSIHVDPGASLKIDSRHSYQQFLAVDGEMVIGAGGAVMLDQASGAKPNPRLTIADGGYLRGSGALNMAVSDNRLTIASGGSVAPGASTGTLNLERLNLNTGSNAEMEIWGTGTAGVDYDQLVGSTLNLEDDWNLNLHFDRIPGTHTLTLFDFNTYNGGFDPNIQFLHGSFAENVSFDSTDGTLTFTNATPEPAGLVLLILSGLGLLCRRQREM
jgi:hypothetical protein